MDLGQRARLVRHASFCSQNFVAGGLVGLVISIFGLYNGAIFALLVPALAALVYSLVYYKQLERRGEIEDNPAP